ncbi:hypothetical protein CHS0354_011068 [Potamilus streckersoni]|nr:hypothetical protein CHS0354_011068 [Potamilus streckersoni]
MAEDDADKSVLIIGYEKPWLERSAILINNSFLDDINESVSKENHGSDYENMDDENKQEFKRLKESQVKSLMPACLASSAEKSQNSPDQNKYNRRNKTFSRKSSRESPNRALSRRTSRGSERKSTSNDAKSSSKGERKSQLTNENPQRSPKKHERSKHVRRSSSKKRKRSSSGMERSRISREKLKRKSEDKTEKKRLDSKSHEGKYDRQ